MVWAFYLQKIFMSLEKGQPSKWNFQVIALRDFNTIATFVLKILVAWFCNISDDFGSEIIKVETRWWSIFLYVGVA